MKDRTEFLHALMKAVLDVQSGRSRRPNGPVDIWSESVVAASRMGIVIDGDFTRHPLVSAIAHLSTSSVDSGVSYLETRIVEDEAWRYYSDMLEAESVMTRGG